MKKKGGESGGLSQEYVRQYNKPDWWLGLIDRINYLQSAKFTYIINFNNDGGQSIDRNWMENLAISCLSLELN